jgi:hypothetical protein
MKYVPIFVPVILILALIAVRLHRPPQAADAGVNVKGVNACEASSSCR